jgi:hypothetical protein
LSSSTKPSEPGVKQRPTPTLHAPNISFDFDGLGIGAPHRCDLGVIGLDRDRWPIDRYFCAVWQWVTIQRSGVLQGTHVDPRKSERPFNDVIAAWRESWAGGLSPTTERRYKSILDKYLIPEFGATPLGRITHEVVQRYINRLVSARGRRRRTHSARSACQRSSATCCASTSRRPFPAAVTQTHSCSR